jgi:hypothetical protein
MTGFRLVVQQVALAGVDAPVHLHGARMQRLDAEEAAVLGQPQDIDHGVPMAQMRDEETDIADAAETVRKRAGVCPCGGTLARTPRFGGGPADTLLLTPRTRQLR